MLTELQELLDKQAIYEVLARLHRFERRDGVWKVAYRIVADDWSFWHDCTEKVAGLQSPPGLSGRDDPLYAVWGARATGARQWQ
jgi:hypothetical protein